MLLGNTSNRDDMMARIDAVVQVQSPGYVAQLEKNIAANATCEGAFKGLLRTFTTRSTERLGYTITVE